ncbi:DUF1735 domain-containing protein [Chitinophaga horti]|uniref:DUF1735 domain-containing protein n=1 Tax=Chitinophaga horti TaxID=2920382 RepID=A0ABY6IUU9_9BACT|nr:DUF1735 domain-containing protein [Chitinophaga horti]UYQ91152.1 DUF1735 domain-containing protein [Chitinophaga horti]
MQRIYIAIICPLLILLAACSKDSSPALLPEGSISFKLSEGKDTIEMPLSILKDSAVVLKLQAAFTGSTSGNHWITFAIDTTKIRDYRARFGQGILVPAPHYLFFKSNVRLSAGATESDTAQLNIGQQTKLMEYSTYVLPIVIQSVDGEPEGAASGRVIYFVFKTGKPLFINKQGWTIAAFTSQNGTNAPTGLLDEKQPDYLLGQ